MDSNIGLLNIDLKFNSGVQLITKNKLHNKIELHQI